MKMLRKLSTMFLVLVTLAGGSAVMAAEEAEYRVLEKTGDFEIREYAPHIVAETSVEGRFDKAGSKAFRRLFAYISGDNQSREKVAMTAPVSQRAGGEKIAMTAPVGQRSVGDSWAVSFMMPSSYTMETIPRPADPNVGLRLVPGHRVAAVRYSGTWSEESYKKHLEKLNQWIGERQLKPVSNPVWAKYDAPFKPWFMRRNEILIEID
jgi:DNA gyrase inhibitor GyrI